jgi:hypothetical protein
MVLGLTHKATAELCGTSMRTAQRWSGGASLPSHAQVLTLARAVFARDAGLAEALAQEAGTSLVAMGVVPPPPPPVVALPPSPPPPPRRPFPPVALMVDSILHAATQSAGAHAADPTSHQAILEITLAAFARARGLGLSVEEVHDALVATGVPSKK